MLVDLEVPQGTALLVSHRADGTTTVMIEAAVVERAYRVMTQTLAERMRRYACDAVAKDLEAANG